jgi:hypothetical protein
LIGINVGKNSSYVISLDERGAIVLRQAAYVANI